MSENRSARVVTVIDSKKRLTLKGSLVIAHEVRSFVPIGDTLFNGVVDKTGELIQEYDRITGGVKMAHLYRRNWRLKISEKGMKVLPLLILVSIIFIKSIKYVLSKNDTLFLIGMFR